MSYNVHIMRDGKVKNSITYDELIRLVNECPELEMRDTMEIKTPKGEIISIPGEYLVWKKEEFDVWLNFHKGKISSSYLEDDGINKLKEIAHKLKAKVVGDEDEEY